MSELTVLFLFSLCISATSRDQHREVLPTVSFNISDFLFGLEQLAPREGREVDRSRPGHGQSRCEAVMAFTTV